MIEKIEAAIQKLKDKGLLKYGTLISKEELEEALGVVAEISNRDPEYWKHRGLFLRLKGKIEDLNFFTTQRNCKGGLLIMSLEEIEAHIKSLESNFRRVQRKGDRILRNAKKNCLPSESSVPRRIRSAALQKKKQAK